MDNGYVIGAGRRLPCFGWSRGKIGGEFLDVNLGSFNPFHPVYNSRLNDLVASTTIPRRSHAAGPGAGPSAHPADVVICWRLAAGCDDDDVFDKPQRRNEVGGRDLVSAGDAVGRRGDGDDVVHRRPTSP